MKNNSFFVIVILTGFAFVFASAIYSSNGRDDNRSGSPLDGSSCAACHGGPETGASGWIATNIPETGYVPGDTYQITATGTHSGVSKFGFQITAETADAKTGTFIITDNTGTKLAGNDDAVSHTNAGNDVTDDSHSWSMEWTAPVSGTGDVTFYAAFNAADGNGGTGGDVIYTEALTINENTMVGIENSVNIELSIAPNPVQNILKLSINEKIENVDIYDLNGKLVKSAKQNNIDVQYLESGSYIVKVKTESGTFTKQIIKK